MGRPEAATQKKGADGESVILEVPLGTVAKDSESGDVELEIMEMVRINPFARRKRWIG